MKNLIKDNPAWPLVLAFILLNILTRGTGGENEMARFTTMRAMSETFSFEITPYTNMTPDWAQTPDGRYLSNKAPGPMLLGFPLFYLIEKISLLGEKKKNFSPGERPTPGPTHSIIISLFMQVLPMAIVLFLLQVNFFRKWGLSDITIQFVTLALLFGNTATIFMNTYFGHGLTSIFILVMAVALIEKKNFYVGLFYGLALLSEYAMVMILLPLMASILISNKQKGIPYFLLGGIIPGLLWTWYHYAAFGHPLETAVHFQNPIFLDMLDTKNNILGIFSPWPNFKVIFKLLFGPNRGILFTVPWLLFLLPITLIKKNKKIFPLKLLALTGLLFLIWMNSSFGQWAGGASAGPRYICAFFPIWALMAGFIYQKAHKTTKMILWILLAISLIFRSLVYSTTILIDNIPLWPWMIKEIADYPGYKLWFRFLLFYFILGASFIYSTMMIRYKVCLTKKK